MYGQSWTSPFMWYPIVSDRTEPDMSFELFEPDKSPVQLNPDFWLEPMSRTLWYLSFKNMCPLQTTIFLLVNAVHQSTIITLIGMFDIQIPLCFVIILSQTTRVNMDCLSIVKSPVQKSGAGVRLIRRSMSGSVQLKNLGLKSLTTSFSTFLLFYTSLPFSGN